MSHSSFSIAQSTLSRNLPPALFTGCAVFFIDTKNPFEKMLRIQWMSGEEITIFDSSTFGTSILALKRHIHGCTGLSRFRQKLLDGSMEAQDGPWENEVLQLVALPFVTGISADGLFQTRYPEKLETLLSEPVDPNLMKDGQTALHLAVQMGSCSCCSLLIEADANMDSAVRSFDDLSPLQLAAVLTNLKVLELLLQSNADTEKSAGFATPLYLAASNNNLQSVRCLIEFAADVNKPTTGGSTPLFTAARKGHMELCRLLLEYGADTEKAPASTGSTPLIAACARNNIEMVRLLIEADADMNATCTDGATAVFVAAQENRIEMIQLLLQKGADKEKALWTTGQTPLLVASQEGHLEIVSLLIRLRANFEAKSSHGLSALDLAMRRSHQHVVQELLRAASAGTVDPWPSGTKTDELLDIGAEKS